MLGFRAKDQSPKPHILSRRMTYHLVRGGFFLLGSDSAVWACVLCLRLPKSNLSK